ncbi:acyltransferase [Pseudomonas weihenstephanensis]|uniref:acyltransferase n=1 Tax=Pseudomonas weihenstephanensis TaxID=1608994 RepID=UPI0006535A6C|nr:acyltransferase family protein [Pseudomonas weihenstephanensis]KMN20314.1 hypothetical protein TU87_01615 [Pseudomonas weihenstephanensis]
MDARIAKLKLIACFLVILLHVSADQAMKFGAGWWASNIYDSLSRVCVPIFLMISGALLLKKSEPLGRFIKKRFIRIFPPLLFWSAFYTWWLYYNGVDVSGWALRILTEPAMYHLWYLYAIVGLYALVPILRRFYNGSTMPEKLWALSLWIIVGSIWPAVSILTSPQSCAAITPTKTAAFYHLSTFGGYAGFLLLGAFLSDMKLNRRVGAIMFAAGSLATMILMHWHSVQVGRPCETFYNYLSPLVVFSAAGFFSYFMSADQQLPSKLLARAADCTLGIYCLHIVLIGGIFPRFGLIAIGESVWFMTPITSVLAFFVSMAIIYIVRLTAPGRYVT